MKNNRLKRIRGIAVICMLLMASALTACGNKNNGTEQRYREKESAVDTGKRPSGNLEMKDADGNVLITIEDIQSVDVNTSQNEVGKTEYVVSIRFTDDGRQKFAEVTEKLVDQILYIYVDGKVVSAPVIKTPISGGKAEIAGLEDENEARDLATKIQGE